MIRKYTIILFAYFFSLIVNAQIDKGTIYSVGTVMTVASGDHCEKGRIWI